MCKKRKGKEKKSNTIALLALAGLIQRIEFGLVQGYLLFLCFVSFFKKNCFVKKDKSNLTEIQEDP